MTRASWWLRDQMGTPPAPQVHEPVKDDKPVLYDSRGKPLVYAKRRIGFRPPDAAAQRERA